MPGACLNSWPPGGCERSVGYLWRSMNHLQRLDLYVLALMLACVVVVVIRSSFRLRRAGCPTLRGFRRMSAASQASQRGLRELLANLRRAARTLKAIASSAPFLGLAGTCVGILSEFHAIAMEHSTARAMITSEISAAPITAAAGILVAVAALVSYNYLCTRIDLLMSEVFDEALDWRSRSAGKFPLTRRFSQLPAFALIAAPFLAIVVAAYMVFPSFYASRGLHVGLAPARCPSDSADRLIVLHITSAGKAFLNLEQEDWDKLAFRLSQIYRLRVHRTLYLLADDDVPLQTVADAIDIAQNAGDLHIRVELVTPAAVAAPCPEPVRVGAPYHASK